MHQRSNGGLLAGIERRVLIAIAGHLPARVTPDHLTTLAVLAMAGAAVSLIWAAPVDVLPTAGADGPHDVRFRFAGSAAGVWAFVGCLALNWFGDSLDGTLARVRRIERPRYGFYVDHVIDLVGVTLLLGGFAISGYMSTVVAIALVAAYAMVSAETFLATHVRGVFHMSFAGVGPTELRVLLAIGLITAYSQPWVDFGGLHVRFFDVSGVIGAAALGLVFIMSALKNGHALYVAEPIPRITLAMCGTAIENQTSAVAAVNQHNLFVSIVSSGFDQHVESTKPHARTSH